MDFEVKQMVIVDGELEINYGDVIRVKTEYGEIMEGTFESASDFLEALTIRRKDSEWSFDFSDIEEIEIK